jgi:glyoxylase-like metal-dependent hydrolase (beta-lactamase superfamily II)
MGEYEIFALKYVGPLTGSGALHMWYKEWDKIVERNYYFWCVKGEGETVVVDTGVSPDLAREKDLAGYVSPPDLLSRIGVRAEEVRHVILTHLHWDHTSGVTLFPNAAFYVQREEYRFWLKDPIAARPPFRYVSDEASGAYLASLEGTGRLKLIRGDQEIFPGIECLLARGHTVGLQAVAVNTAKGTAVLGSDCAHVFRNYREDWPSALITDLVALMKTYDKLKGKASSPDLIFPGHDPIMTSDYPTVARDVTRLA